MRQIFIKKTFLLISKPYLLLKFTLTLKKRREQPCLKKSFILHITVQKSKKRALQSTL